MICLANHASIYSTVLNQFKKNNSFFKRANVSNFCVEDKKECTYRMKQSSKGSIIFLKNDLIQFYDGSIILYKQNLNFDKSRSS